jgi:hypothetical protein
MRPTLLAAIACLWSGAAFAAPPPAPAAPTPPSPNIVSPVTVYPRTDAPKLAKSFPAAGQALSAGVTVLSLTFDQPMMKGSFDLGPAPTGEPLHCLKTPRLLDDNRTFVVLCTTEPHKSYVLALNARPEGGFRNVGEHRADPATLAFSTTDGDGPGNVHEALKAAGLREIDMPIQDTPELLPVKPAP